MIVELGHYALVLTLLTACVQLGSGFLGGHKRNPQAIALAGAAARVQAGLAIGSFASLSWAHAASDFSVLNVYQNSNAALPLIYRLAGVWGNHEGSMLLWIMTLAVLGALVASIDPRLPPTFRARVLGTQALVSAVFTAFSLFTSDPFIRVSPRPTDGLDLNPLLQDPGLAFHPPFLYLGFVGFSVPFSFGVAALLEGRLDPAWARWVRPWTLLAWSSLTTGICLGAAWAYYVLGWGGYWSWDPVENGSLMPWLAGTALLHCVAVVEKRDTLKAWTLLLSIVAFSTSILSTFVVRSGLLTSVHAFANDPKRGLALLAMCLALTGGALGLYAARASMLKAGGLFQTVSRESALIVNNVLLCSILSAVAFGTFWPMLADVILDQHLSVGGPYYVRTAVPLALFLALFMSIGLQTPWKRGDLMAIFKRLRVAAFITLTCAAIALWLSQQNRLLSVVGVTMAVWIFAGAVTDIAARLQLSHGDYGQSWRRAVNLPRSVMGAALAHGGLGICVLGMVGASLWSSERLTVMRPGDQLKLAGFRLRFDEMSQRNRENFESEVGRFTVFGPRGTVDRLYPERRWYPVSQTRTTQAANRLTPFGDLYLVAGDPRDGGGYVVRATVHPLVGLIWFGALTMALGGGLSLSDQRYRLGAPAQRPRLRPNVVAAE